MTTENIREAQAFLTAERDGEIRKILDIETLLSRHRREEVLDFLRELAREKRMALRDLVTDERSSPLLNQTVANLFRLHMAIRVLERETSEMSGCLDTTLSDDNDVFPDHPLP